MELELKKDFDKVMQRWEAWWNCQIIDRAVVTLYVRPGKQPRSGKRPRPPRKKHATLRDRWLDVEYCIDSIEAG